MINIYEGHACIAGYPSEGNVRVATSEERVPSGSLPCPVFVRQGTTVHGLPEPESDTILVVSAMVRSACPERLDLVSPGSGRESLIRDASGAVIGCRDFDAQPAILKMFAKEPIKPNLTFTPSPETGESVAPPVDVPQVDTAPAPSSEPDATAPTVTAEPQPV